MGAKALLKTSHANTVPGFDPKAGAMCVVAPRYCHQLTSCEFRRRVKKVLIRDPVFKDWPLRELHHCSLVGLWERQGLHSPRELLLVMRELENHLPSNRLECGDQIKKHKDAGDALALEVLNTFLDEQTSKVSPLAWHSTDLLVPIRGKNKLLGA